MICEVSSMILMTPCARSPSDAAATPKNREKTTICRISLLAIASTALFGTRWVTKSLNDNEAALRFVAALASGSGRLRLSPGRRMLTMIKPSSKDTNEALTNHNIALPPIRPTDLVSPICATPTTKVVKTSGAMIILIRRRKMTKVSRCERMALSPFGERLQNASSYRVRKPSCPRRGCWAPTLTSWLQPEKRSAVGLGGDDPDRHHRLRVGALNFECLDYRGQDQGGFGQRELRADAYSRT